MPEKRLDKNNKLVTRHVKTGLSSPGAGRIPGPQIAQRNDDDDQQLVSYASPRNADDFLEKVRLAPPELVRRINVFYENHKPSGRITREIADQTIGIIGASRIKNAPRYIELLDTHFDFLKSLGQLNSNGINIVNGLIDVQDRTLRGMEPMTEKQQQAVIKVTKAMIQDNRTVDRIDDYEFRLRHDLEHLVLSDDDLLKLVVERPQDADVIADMVANGHIRSGQIKAALDDNIQQPLLGGAL